MHSKDITWVSENFNGCKSQGSGQRLVKNIKFSDHIKGAQLAHSNVQILRQKRCYLAVKLLHWFEQILASHRYLKVLAVENGLVHQYWSRKQILERPWASILAAAFICASNTRVFPQPHTLYTQCHKHKALASLACCLNVSLFLVSKIAHELKQPLQLGLLGGICALARLLKRTTQERYYSDPLWPRPTPKLISMLVSTCAR